MQTQSRNPTIGVSKTKEKPKKKEMSSSQLEELFEEQLKDINWSEKAIAKALPKIISMASSKELAKGLTDHLEETREQINRLKKVFKSIGKKPSTVKCEAMQGLIIEALEVMEDCEKGPKCDAGIISASQKIEHYEIATYGTLREFAETMGLKKAEKLLKESLAEEKATDQLLTEVAVTVVNTEAATKKS